MGWAIAVIASSVVAAEVVKSFMPYCGRGSKTVSGFPESLVFVERRMRDVVD